MCCKIKYENQLLDFVKKINEEAVLLDEKLVVFEEIFNCVINDSNYELGYKDTIAVLYKLYRECGRVSVNYLISKMNVYECNETYVKNHILLIDKMRTFFYHNLILSSKHDKEIITICEKWFETNCNSKKPVEENEWGSCLNQLQLDSIECLNNIYTCVIAINRDYDFKDDIIEEWILKKNLDFPKHKCIPLVEEIAKSLGRDIDYVLIVDKNYSKWMKELKYSSTLNIDNFIDNLKKVIEYTVLEETGNIMPITGKDIILEFGIKPGRLVGSLMEKAKDIYNNNKSINKEELLKSLSEEL